MYYPAFAKEGNLIIVWIVGGIQSSQLARLKKFFVTPGLRQKKPLTFATDN
ncbi:MAG TPA: hypothetical protein PLH29_03775 [bacterium]|nr:hypothetical protein [bacterium]